MMYKVGDEVLIKGKVLAVEGISTKFYNIEVLDSLHNTVCVSTNSVADKTYEQGLADAWELAKKILEMCGEKREEILGLGSYANILEFVKPEEGLAKIEAYEKEKEINIGSIVKVKDEKGEAIVTAVCPTGVAYIMWKDGSGGDYELTELEKTGRTAEGLDLLLRQIKE